MWQTSGILSGQCTSATVNSMPSHSLLSILSLDAMMLLTSLGRSQQAPLHQLWCLFWISSNLWASSWSMQTFIFSPYRKTYTFKVMPFGPCNAPSVYITMMCQFKDKWESLFNFCSPIPTLEDVMSLLTTSFYGHLIHKNCLVILSVLSLFVVILGCLTALKMSFPQIPYWVCWLQLHTCWQQPSWKQMLPHQWLPSTNHSEVFTIIHAFLQLLEQERRLVQSKFEAFLYSYLKIHK